MKKLMAIGIAIAMMSAFIPAVTASDTETITVEATFNPCVDIIIDNESWATDGAQGDITSTGEVWNNITNNGTVDVSIEVKAEMDTGSVWELVTTTPDHDQWCIDLIGDLGNYALNQSADDLGMLNANGVGTYYKTFGLNVTFPESSSTQATQTATITFTATAN